MERETWTDERLDDLAIGMREGFARVDQNFVRVDQTIRDVRTELKAEIAELRHTMIRGGIGLIGAMSIGFLSVLGAILARGA
jgi:hypothetical protein